MGKERQGRDGSERQDVGLCLEVCARWVYNPVLTEMLVPPVVNEAVLFLTSGLGELELLPSFIPSIPCSRQAGVCL